jgi:hypothetical protein
MTHKETLEKLGQGKYVNNKEIVLGGVPFTARDVLVKAPLVAAINVYLVGGTGEGKTELANDLVSYFGDKACYNMGRPDFEPADLLKQVRLDRLKDAKSDRELVELTENVKSNLFYVDELNRCPPIVQNYFFDFFDGKLVHQGRIRRLGTDGYTLGYATGNLGNGEYVGVSDSDRALLDRMHMIVKLDHPDFATTESDDFDIFSGKKNPRASMPEGEDISQEIISLHKSFCEGEVPLLLPALGVYLTKGLDYVENTSAHSKRALGPRWAQADGVRTDNDENKIHPLSKRAVFGAISLASALELIARENGHEPQMSDLFLDSLRLTVPYSGVISPAFVDMSHGEDVYEAFDALLGEGSRNRVEIKEKVDAIEEACLFAEAGKKEVALLDAIAPLGGNRWSCVRNALSQHADKRKEDPSEKGQEIKSFLEKAHEE